MSNKKSLGGARLATFLTYLTDVESGGFTMHDIPSNLQRQTKMFWWNIFLGRTVFPGLNISVLPQRGSALLWITVLRYKKCSNGQKKMKRNFFKVRPEEQYDTRMFHMGCPVARCQAIYCCASKERLWFQFLFHIYRWSRALMMLSCYRGNKWAATKWVYSYPQMWTQLCQVDKPHNYPPFQNPFLWPPQQCEINTNQFLQEIIAFCNNVCWLTLKRKCHRFDLYSWLE